MSPVCVLCYDKVFYVNKNLTLPMMKKLVTNCHKHLTSTPFPARHSTSEIDPNKFSLCQRCMDSGTKLTNLADELETCKKELSNSANKLSFDILRRRMNNRRNRAQTTDLISNSDVGQNAVDPLVEEAAPWNVTGDEEAPVVNEQVTNSGRSRSVSDFNASESTDETSSILSDGEEMFTSNEQIDNVASENPKCSRGDVGPLTRAKIKLQTVQLKNYLKNARKSKKKTNRYFKCLHCSKVYCSAWELTNHIRIHTGYKPFKCFYCGKSLNSASGLNEHMRIHTGEKPYKCSTCGQEFAIFSSKRRHAKLHTGEKAYKCKFCGRKFNRKNNMKNHIRLSHEL